LRDTASDLFSHGGFGRRAFSRPDDGDGGQHGVWENMGVGESVGKLDKERTSEL
jgi:hypothetical protein